MTGIWGITFLIGWFASVVNWAWERGFVWPRIRTGTILYAVVLVVVFLAGLARLALTSPGPGVVRVAAISASKQAAATASSLLTAPTVDALEAGTATPAQQAAARAAFTSLDDDLLAATASRRKPARRSSPGPRRPLSAQVCWRRTGSAFLQRPSLWPGNTTSISNSDSACSCPARPGRPT